MTLQFTSVDAFNQYSIGVANQLKNMKVSTLRTAMAQAEGFSSLPAYYDALKSKESIAILNKYSAGDFVFLTNGGCENSEHLSEADFLDDLGLEAGEWEGEFYPLTEKERQYIGEDAFSPMEDEYGMMGYSVYCNDQKYLYLNFEIPYLLIAQENYDDKAGAYAKHIKLRDLILAACEKLNGLIDWHDDYEYEFTNDDGSLDEGKYQSGMLVPFETAYEKASDFNEWQNYLNELFASIATKLDK